MDLGDTLADNSPVMQVTMSEAAEIANSHQQEGRFDVAADIYRQLIEHDPENPTLHLCLGQVLLLMGEFDAGWQEYEWRWVLFAKERPDYPVPKWEGAELEGKVIFVHGEQGYGDNIQFIRYATMVAQKGGRVVVGSPPGLRPLLPTAEGIEAIVEPNEPIPPFETHIPLASLPRVFGTRLESIPAAVPYLRSENSRVEAWKQRFSLNDRLNVGICWQANPKFAADRFRSVSLRQFEPLLRVPGVDFHGLQILHGREQMAGLSKDVNFEDIGDELFSETAVLAEAAAALQALDLIVTVDTAICHLSGALGRPTWVALSLVPDWRWLMGRDDSPWYPTIRLFRQVTHGGWDDVFRRLAKALTLLVEERGREP